MNKYNNPWSQRDLKKLRKLYRLKTLKELSVIFGRPGSKVCRKAGELGIRKDRKVVGREISKRMKESYRTGKRKKLLGENHPRWKNGRYIHSAGYVSVFMPDHPNASNKRVLEHRLVVEKSLGRLLKRGEIVHHKNGDKLDNRLKNLEVMTQSQHIKKHRDNMKRTYGKHSK